MMDFFAGIVQYKFLSNAAIACVLAGIACGITGAYVVCRRMVFLSGGITHASFGGIGIAYYLGMNPIMGAMAFAVLSALGIEMFSSKARIREDSAIGLLWSLGMAIGIIFIYMTPGYAPNLMSFLFGNIVTVTSQDIVQMSAVAVAAVAVFLIFHRTILYVAFDREYSATQNMPVKFINYAMSALIAVTIVMSIRVAGIVLLISLLTIPAIIINELTKSFAKIAVWASVTATVCTLAGLFISYKTDIPSGASTIFVLAFVLIIVKLLPLSVKRSR